MIRTGRSNRYAGFAAPLMSRAMLPCAPKAFVPTDPILFQPRFEPSHEPRHHRQGASQSLPLL
jgi:hypothetical protein